MASGWGVCAYLPGRERKGSYLDSRDVNAFQSAPPALNATRPVPEALTAEVIDLLKSQRRKLTDLSIEYERITDGARPERSGGGEVAA